uniref:Uncharacterized protein n=1 Tax=Arundo donax TaxID=35708 RepID=A0A0A9I0J9_ARUDO
MIPTGFSPRRRELLELGSLLPRLVRKHKAITGARRRAVTGASKSTKCV